VSEPGPEPELTIRPVDDRRLAKLQLGALAILKSDRPHTPLERRWAQEVLDLCVALGEARGSLGPDAQQS
jgi:hypothetical protein